MYLLGTGFLPGGSGVEGFAGPVQRKIQVMKHQFLNSVRINFHTVLGTPTPLYGKSILSSYLNKSQE